jgi:hypothetical protein
LSLRKVDSAAFADKDFKMLTQEFRNEISDDVTPPEVHDTSEEQDTTPPEEPNKEP